MVGFRSTAGFRLAVGLALVVGLAGCGSEQDTTTTTSKTVDAGAAPVTDAVMPDVLGLKLDVAKSDIKSSGFEDEVEVLDDGTFGVQVESNWTVCEQVPAAGETVTVAPRLTVSKSCEDGSSTDSTEPSTDTAPAPSDQASDEPAKESEESESNEPAAEEILTAENNEELAALLVKPGECDDSFAAFAAKYRGRTIQFDGNIAYMENHGSATTRFDFLIYTADYDADAGNPGPSFRFQDVASQDLKFPGENTPDSVAMGDNLRFTAKVKEFTTGCLLELDPVATEVR